MRALILEDSESRLDKFRQNLIGCVLDITKNPLEANKWLLEKEYDYIFLDHDLEDWHYEYDGALKEETGLQTADFIGQRPDIQKTAKIYIHSLNPAGTNRMAAALRRPCYIVPFYNLFK
jgi:hypothetical protein